MNPDVYPRTACRCCGRQGLSLVLNLGPTPMLSPNAGSAGGRADDLSRHLLPLELMRCPHCTHIQLSNVVSPELLYPDFRYTTLVSLGLKEHFTESTQRLISTLGLKKGDFVVEIGSNDGTFLKPFQQAGLRVLGIDPAREIAEQATAEGIETLPAFFDASLGADLKEKYGPARLVLSTNTFANLDDLDGIMAGVLALLEENGYFVIETQHGQAVIQNKLIDTVYPEHLSYFTITSLRHLMARHGLSFVHVSLLSTKGGSLRAVFRRSPAGAAVSPEVEQAITAESQFGMDRDSTFVDFRQSIEKARARVIALVDQAVSEGRPIYGYGASIGTTTLIHYFKLQNKVSYIFDDKPLAKVMRGPGYEIPIRYSHDLYDLQPGLIVVFAWRYAQQIFDRHPDYARSGGGFLIPLPDPGLHPPDPRREG